MLGAVHALTGTLQCIVQLASVALGVTTIAAKAPVHAGNLAPVLANPLHFAMRNFAILPPGTGTCAKFVQATIDTIVKSPVLCTKALTVPPFSVCNPAPFTARMAEVPAVELSMVPLVAPACVSPGFAAISPILAPITPGLTIFGLTALSTSVVGTPSIAVTPLCISALLTVRPAVFGRIAVTVPCSPALTLFSSLIAFRTALLTVGFCALRGPLAGVTAWHIFRLCYGRCGQPERGGGKQRDHNS